MVMMRNVKSFEYLTRILRIAREHCAYIVRDLFFLHAVSVKDSILHCVADRYRFVIYVYNCGIAANYMLTFFRVVLLLFSIFLLFTNLDECVLLTFPQ